MLQWSILAILISLGNLRAGDDNSPEYLLRQDLRSRAASMQSFTRQHGMDNQLFFLVDMTQPSGKKRFYVYDYAKDSILFSGLVSHGRCNLNWLTGRRYSNNPGSGCTSLGRYKVGASYNGQFGKSYRLQGLDSTNNKAAERAIVLHAAKSIPDREVAPGQIAQSDGCPAVSPVMLGNLDALIRTRNKPIMLYIYEENENDLAVSP
ncbi:MAG: murein L,D-transpeptidase catalytic domain family protein [Flavihumibacter sp.]